MTWPPEIFTLTSILQTKLQSYFGKIFAESVLFKEESKIGETKMTIILVLIAASFITSTLVVSACAMSSRISQREGICETFDSCEEPAPHAAKTITPFSAN